MLADEYAVDESCQQRRAGRRSQAQRGGAPKRPRPLAERSSAVAPAPSTRERMTRQIRPSNSSTMMMTTTNPNTPLGA